MTRNCLSARCQHVVFERFFSWTISSERFELCSSSRSSGCKPFEMRHSSLARAALSSRPRSFGEAIKCSFRTFKSLNDRIIIWLRLPGALDIKRICLLASWRNRNLEQPDRAFDPSIFRSALDRVDTHETHCVLRTVAAIQLLACGALLFAPDTVLIQFSLGSVGCNPDGKAFDPRFDLVVKMLAVRTSV